MLNGGDIAFACQQGLTLPTTLSNATFDTAIKFKIAAADGSIADSEKAVIDNIKSL